MDHFEQLKDLWLSHELPHHLPSLAEINHAIKTYQKEKRKHTVFMVLLSLICILAMVYVMMQYQSHLWSTRLGELLFIFIAVYLVISKYALLQKNAREEILSTHDYLEVLKKKTQRTTYDKIHPVLYVVLTAAFSLYVYEMLSESKVLLITGYTLLILFLGFMWFFFKPFMKIRHTIKIQVLLEKIDLIIKQSNEKS